jgi:tetratricopeptide (TPR) repeat protein
VGALYRYVPANETPVDDPRYWREPMAPEDVIRAFRRERGQFVEPKAGGIRVRPEPYEKRLLRLILLIRRNQALIRTREGNLAEAERLYDSVLALDPWMRDDGTILMPLAVVKAGLQKYDRAEELFKTALTCELEPKRRAEASYFLSALCAGRPEGAEWKAKALASPDLAPELRAKLEGR